MAGVSLRVAAWARTSWTRVVPVIVVVALAAATPFALAAGTRRTETAPDRLTVAEGGDPDLVLYQSFGDPLTEEIRQVDGVESAIHITFVAAFPMADDGRLAFEANPFAGDDEFFGARVVEGRFTDPSTRTSSPPTEPRPRCSAARWDRPTTSCRTRRSRSSAASSAATPRSSDRELARPSSASPRHRRVQRPDAADRLLGVLPQRVRRRRSGCIDHRDPRRPGADRARVLESIRAVAGGTELFELEPLLVTQGARDAVRVFTRSYWIVTLITILAAALIVAQLVTRHVRSTPGEREPLLALGYTRRQMVVEAAVQGAVIGTIAAIVAGSVAIAVSGTFPLGRLGTLEPTPGIMADWTVVAIGAVALVSIASGAAALSAARAVSRRSGPRPRRVAIADRIANAGASAPVVHGVRYALSREARRSVPPVAFTIGIALSLAALVGALVVGTSLVTATDSRRPVRAELRRAVRQPLRADERRSRHAGARRRRLVDIAAATTGHAVDRGHRRAPCTRSSSSAATSAPSSPQAVRHRCGRRDRARPPRRAATRSRRR
jgi:hypothetical protein